MIARPTNTTVIHLYNRMIGVSRTVLLDSEHSHWCLVAPVCCEHSPCSLRHNKYRAHPLVIQWGLLLWLPSPPPALSLWLPSPPPALSLWFSPSPPPALSLWFSPSPPPALSLWFGPSPPPALSLWLPSPPPALSLWFSPSPPPALSLWFSPSPPPALSLWFSPSPPPALSLWFSFAARIEPNNKSSHSAPYGLLSKRDSLN